MAEASLFSSSSSPPPFHNTAALVDFLRREADEAEKRAKRLRRQANALITQYGITAEQQKQYGKTIPLQIHHPFFSQRTDLTGSPISMVK